MVSFRDKTGQFPVPCILLCSLANPHIREVTCPTLLKVVLLFCRCFNREGATLAPGVICLANHAGESAKVLQTILKKGRLFGVGSVSREIEDESFYSVFHQRHIAIEQKAEFASAEFHVGQQLRFMY